MKDIDKFNHIISIDPKKRLGEQVGNYRIIRWLGGGAFADVYLGEHIYLKMQSAIKMLHVHLPKKAQKDFLNEACAIAGLDHPNIVRILDYGVENGNPFLVMAYAPNGSLQQRFPDGTRLSLEQVVPLVQQMASALDYAHEQGLIHRDVKPENMLIGAQDQILLSDFGLVLLAEGTHTQAINSSAGTILYMSPEQLEGKVHFASDQYALGIVTYRWLCGEYPFTGTYIQVGTQHVLASLPSLCKRVPDLPPLAEYVVFRALAKDRAQRYENVTAFANALQDASEDALATSISSLQSPTSLSKTSSQPVEALSQATEISILPETVRSTQLSQSPNNIRRIILLAIAIVAIIGSGTGLWYSVASSLHVTSRSTAPSIIRGIPTTKLTVLPHPLATVLYPTPQTTSTHQITPTHQAISTPSPIALRINAIDDSIQGTSIDQFNYVGNGWQHCTGGCGDNPPGLYNGSNSWDNTTNDYMTITFNGTQIKFYGVVGPPHGIGAVSIDGGAETMMDFYSPTEAADTLLYASPVLVSRQHTLKVRVTGNQNSNATWNGINPDRVDILS